MKYSMILMLLASTSAHATEFNQQALNCAEASSAINAGQQLNLVGQFLKKYIFPQDLGPRLHKEEQQFLLNHPDTAMVIRGAACRSYALSMATCGLSMKKLEMPRAIDEEADAIRHFAFASAIACSIGKTKALDYTTAHEGAPPWENDSKMDISNNGVGIAWADPQFGRCQQYGDMTVAKAALKQLSNKKLVTLKKGDTPCANPQQSLDALNAIDEVDFIQKVNDEFVELQKIAPSLCGKAQGAPAPPPPADD